MLVFSRHVTQPNETRKSSQVYLNGKQIACNSFEKYIDMYLPPPPVVQAEPASVDTSMTSEEGDEAKPAKVAAPSKPKVHFVQCSLFEPN